MMPFATIGGRTIGLESPCFIVAELSANHGGHFEVAEELVRTAKACGADAVKLQTYTPDTLTIDCSAEHFRIGAGTLWAGRTLYDLYREAHTPWEWYARLQPLAADLGLLLFSTPFDETAVDYLDSLSTPAYKVASFENVDLPLLRRVARSGKPIVLSTGMATLGEIEEAVQTIEKAGGKELVLLKCTSAYPASPDEMHLRTIPHLRDAFGLPVGLSDHTLGTAVAIAAVTLGACVVEKHLTLSRATPGPDSAFSLEPAEFQALVASIRTAERGLGRVQYGPAPAELPSCAFRRSLFIVQDVRDGDLFTPENVRAIRPGYGLHTRYLDHVLGRRAACHIRRGTPLAWDHVAGKPPEASGGESSVPR
jgi:pseudaminic acid synthase